jgi:hypothetical protein
MTARNNSNQYKPFVSVVTKIGAKYILQVFILRGT